jgi:pSer/pThr/pTyr-binding forkhead associated (FHA) protein
MEFVLVVRSGDAAGKKIPVPPGESRRVGRQSPSDVRVADDPMLSNQHFAVECDGSVCILRDLGSKFGTLLNGNKFGETAALRNGDEIRAGRTVFGVEVIGDIRATPLMPSDDLPPDSPAAAVEASAVPVPQAAPAGERPPLTDRQSAVLAHLRKQVGVFAVLDAARDPDVLPRLKVSGVEHASLYEENDGEELSTYGPWLAKLPVDHEFLEALVRDGWGKSWGVFLTCRLPFAELRRHLRQFLLAKLPDGRQVCFRYYDPRVLRTYMPTCTSDEMARFVGPIERYFAESTDEDELLEFGASYRDWRKVRLDQGSEP